MNEKVTPRQRKAIEGLLTNGDITAASHAAGVSRQSIYRWMGDATFQEALKEAEKDAIAGLSRALVAMGECATRTLREAMSDPEASPGVKIRAADIVLNRMLELKNLFDLEERILKLEEAVKNGNKH